MTKSDDNDDDDHHRHLFAENIIKMITAVKYCAQVGAKCSG